MLFGGCARLRQSRDAADETPRSGGNTQAGQAPGARSRGDINVLMCGDPGTSKSQLLSYVHKIAPRGVYTSGKGSSAVGLTAAVTRDPETRELVMESGAVVLSDLGICCIDEFDKMSDMTRAVLHEAMEQQTISLAKAGIVATLNARASIFAAANPVDSRYNPKLSVVENIQLPPTLLSRFDLIYLILDHADRDADRRLAQHIVKLYEAPTTNGEAEAAAPVAGAADERFLRDYVAYARHRVHPELADEARQELIDAYVRMRGGGSSRPNRGRSITATPRQLEGMIRIAEALARMRLETRVVRADVLEAVRLMQVSRPAREPSVAAPFEMFLKVGISATFGSGRRPALGVSTSRPRRRREPIRPGDASSRVRPPRTRSGSRSRGEISAWHPRRCRDPPPTAPPPRRSGRFPAQVATLAAATDATTGLIDMDAINTGRTAADRALHEGLCRELRRLVAARPRGAAVGVAELRDEMQAQSDEPLDQFAFLKAVQGLAAEDFLTHNERSGTVLRK